MNQEQIKELFEKLRSVPDSVVMCHYNIQRRFDELVNNVYHENGGNENALRMASDISRRINFDMKLSEGDCFYLRKGEKVDFYYGGQKHYWFNRNGIQAIFLHPYQFERLTSIASLPNDRLFELLFEEAEPDDYDGMRSEYNEAAYWDMRFELERRLKDCGFLKKEAGT